MQREDIWLTEEFRRSPLDICVMQRIRHANAEGRKVTFRNSLGIGNECVAQGAMKRPIIIYRDRSHPPFEEMKRWILRYMEALNAERVR